MALYQLPLPPLELLPVSIPEHIHPLFVHFAIALPIVILLIELYNLVAKRRSIAVLSLIFMVLLALTVFGAIATGITDAKLATVSSEVKELILEHKAISTYLLYGVGVLIVLKLLALFVSKNIFKLAYVIFTLIFIATTFYEGKLGGGLVYKHGVNVGEKATKGDTEAKNEEPKPEETKTEEAKKEEAKAEEAKEKEETTTNTNPETKTEESTSIEPKTEHKAVEQEPKKEANNTTIEENHESNTTTNEPKTQHQETIKNETEESKTINQEAKESNNTESEKTENNISIENNKTK